MSEFYVFDLEKIILTLLAIINAYYLQRGAEGMLNSVTDTCSSVLGCAGLKD